MNDSFYIQKCIEKIEEKVQWGEVKFWTHEDFLSLSNQIKDASGVSLSPTTLKRLFGKAKTYKEAFYNPQKATKTALAIYLGYSNWEAFKSSQKENEAKKNPLLSEETSDSLYAGTPEPKWRKYLTSRISILVAGFIIVLALFIFKFFFNQPKGENHFLFKGKNLTGKIPLTVTFDFDISNYAGDSFYFESSSYEKVKLTEKKGTIHHTYEAPNYYYAKLFADGKEISSLPIHAISKDWMAALIYNKPGKLSHESPNSSNSNYIPLIHIIPRGDGKLRLDTSQISHLDRVPHVKEYWTEFRYFYEFNVDGDNFTYETKLRAIEDSSGCSNLTFNLVGEENKLKFHLSNQDCNTLLRIRFSEFRQDSEDFDLSMFRQNITEWSTIRMEVRNRKVELFFNGTSIFTITYGTQVGNIKGIINGFKGHGEMDYVRLYNEKHELVYKDDFD